MSIQFKDFIVRDRGVNRIKIARDAMNTWLANNPSSVINVETLQETRSGGVLGLCDVEMYDLGIRVWFLPGGVPASQVELHGL
jgi:hypothetical protein